MIFRQKKQEYLRFTIDGIINLEYQLRVTQSFSVPLGLTEANLIHRNVSIRRSGLKNTKTVNKKYTAGKIFYVQSRTGCSKSNEILTYINFHRFNYPY